jgi:hypothetical protein
VSTLQAAKSSAAAASNMARIECTREGEKGMWALIAEMVLALCILVFIVWWTMRGKK